MHALVGVWRLRDAALWIVHVAPGPDVFGVYAAGCCLLARVYALPCCAGAIIGGEAGRASLVAVEDYCCDWKRVG